MRNAQEIFDQVSKHLLTQNVKSRRLVEKGILDTDGILCAYRGDNSTSCAIGCLIPDAVYSSAMEGKGVRELTASLLHSEDISAKELGTEFEAHIHLLSELQQVHDYLQPNQWRKELTAVASRYGLDAQRLIISPA